jgi:exonuclease III
MKILLTLGGLILRLLRAWASRWPARTAAAAMAPLLALAALPVMADSCLGEEVRVATFNIEDFPKSPRQVPGAFAAILESDADIVAVQEIRSTTVLKHSARALLGPEWKFVSSRRATSHRLGVLYDSEMFTVLSTKDHTELELYRGARPAFEVRLRSRDDSKVVVRVITVHLKAGSDGESVRRKQLDALEAIVRKARGSGDKLVVLGDFNSTSNGDQVRIGKLARAARMEWATEKIECTSYWRRNDGCVGSRLDHILTSEPVDAAVARGACETEGCDRKPQCPVYREHVSDHCPVTVDLDF